MNLLLLQSSVLHEAVSKIYGQSRPRKNGYRTIFLVLLWMPFLQEHRLQLVHGATSQSTVRYIPLSIITTIIFCTGKLVPDMYTNRTRIFKARWNMCSGLWTFIVWKKQKFCSSFRSTTATNRTWAKLNPTRISAIIVTIIIRFISAIYAIK